MSDLPFVRYTSSDDDNERWLAFPFREGDIVISTRSKSGTTWMQMICALLVFGEPDLPAPLAELSPWIDHTIEPIDDVVSHLEAQRHRRFVKTHTPLDGLPLDARATYVVVARHPLDMAVSLYHQGANIDRRRLAELTGAPPPPAAPTARPELRDWLLDWIDRDVEPRSSLDSLPGVVHHAADAWRRRAAKNVVLVHYADLVADLDGEMRRLAKAMDLAPAWLPRADPPRDSEADLRWQQLVRAASFEAMRDRAEDVVPNRLGVLKDNAAFFRRGGLGSGRAVLSENEYAHYLSRIGSMAEDDVLAWLNR
jgi:hypothetical protein